VQVDQQGRRVHAELAVEGRPRRAVRREGGVLASGAVEREHEMRPQLLARGVLAQQVLDRDDDVGGPAAGQLGRRPGLRRGDPLVLQCHGARLGELELPQVGQRAAPPEVERIGQQRRPGGGIALLGRPRPVAGPLGEHMGVGVARERVPGIARDQQVPRADGGEALAEHADVVLQGVARGGREVLAPDSLQQVVDTDDAAAGQRQHGDDRAQLGSAGRDVRAVDRDGQRSEQAHRHGAHESVTRPSCRTRRSPPIPILSRYVPSGRPEPNVRVTQPEAGSSVG